MGKPAPSKAVSRLRRPKGSDPQPGPGWRPSQPPVRTWRAFPGHWGSPPHSRENPPPRCYWGRSPRPRRPVRHSDHSRAAWGRKRPAPHLEATSHQARPRLPLGALEFRRAGSAPGAPRGRPPALPGSSLRAHTHVLGEAAPHRKQARTERPGGARAEGPARAPALPHRTSPGVSGVSRPPAPAFTPSRAARPGPPPGRLPPV